MANTLDSIVPKIIASAMLTLRKNLPLIGKVNRNYEAELKTKGNVVDIPFSAPATTASVSPSMTWPTPGNLTIPKTQVTLDQWKYTACQVADDEVAKAEVEKGFVPGQVMENIAALVDDVHTDLAARYKSVYGTVGTAGTTPFASNIDVVADANFVLNGQKCPKIDRKAVIDLNAGKNLQKLSQLLQAQQAGDSKMLRDGEIGRLLKVDFEDSFTMPTHTSTALSAGACTVNGVQAVNAGSTDNGRTGTLSINKLTNTAALVAGDILEFTVGGVVQQHVVTANTTLAVGNTSVPVAPALRVATAGAEAVTLRASHVANLIFNPQAFALAVRPAQDFVMKGDPNDVFTYTQPDPVTGLAFRVQIVRGFMMRSWYFDILWGTACPRPELACRLLG